MNGRFYFAGASPSGWQLYAYNPATPAASPVRVGIINIPAARNNGDMAFDSLGNLYVVAGNIGSPPSSIYRVGQVPITAGSGTLTATVLTSFSPPRNVGGIAFNAAGELMVSSGVLTRIQN